LTAGRIDNPGIAMPKVEHCAYFPAIVCILCDSPVDALVALCVRRDEAMMIVTAARGNLHEMECFVATLHGGRPIAVLRTPEGRWAACNAFVDELFATPEAAARKLARLLKRGRQGYVGYAQDAADLQPNVQAA
jgi:hypothetical protein